MAQKNAPVSASSFHGVIRTEQLLMVNPLDLHVIEGFNPRSDEHADIEVLMHQIAEYGVTDPLHVFESGGRLFITSGHRRRLACKLLAEKGIIIKTVPAILEPKKLSESEMLIRALQTNEGKPLSEYDEANAYRRLLAHGDTLAEIAKATGKPEGVISARLDLLEADKSLIRELQAGKVGVSKILAALKKAKKENIPQVQALADVTNPANDKRTPEGKAKLAAEQAEKDRLAAEEKQKAIDEALAVERAKVAESQSSSTSPTAEVSSPATQEKPNNVPSEPVVGSNLVPPAVPPPVEKKGTGGNPKIKSAEFLSDDDYHAELAKQGLTAEQAEQPAYRMAKHLRDILALPDMSLQLLVNALLVQVRKDALVAAVTEALKHYDEAHSKVLVPTLPPVRHSNFPVIQGKPGSGQAAFKDSSKS